ncbi:MAG: hypothetical protein LBF37_02130 [Rickettsiales bacterium]|nr:hypothetical protein [Rickettsiales bacterium]
MKGLAIFGLIVLCIPAQGNVSSKDYVDRIQTALAASVANVYTKSESDALYATAAQGVKADTAVQPGSLHTVATSGDYNELKNKPVVNSLYNILSNQKVDATTNDEFFLDMDGLRFKVIKQSTANYWAARIINNTGASVSYASRGMHQYSGVQLTGKQGTIASGAELNPDTESGDIGYSQGDVFITHFFDNTNMHLYRWTIHVNQKDAIMVLEKLN